MFFTVKKILRDCSLFLCVYSVVLRFWLLGSSANLATTDASFSPAARRQEVGGADFSESFQTRACRASARTCAMAAAFQAEHWPSRSASNTGSTSTASSRTSGSSLVPSTSPRPWLRGSPPCAAPSLHHCRRPPCTAPSLGFFCPGHTHTGYSIQVRMNSLIIYTKRYL